MANCALKTLILIFDGICACKVKYTTTIVRISEVGSMEFECPVDIFLIVLKIIFFIRLS